jgi:Domain of unknown function (DUF3471)
MSEPARLLPALPCLEHLRKQARRQLRRLRAADPATTLAAAQFALAREYGFASWRQLKSEVERRAGAAPPAPAPVADYRRYLGHYRQEPPLAANIVYEIGETGGRLYLAVADGPRLPLHELGDGWLGQPGIRRRYRFATDRPEEAAALILETVDQAVFRFERTDAATAARIAADRAAARIEQEQPRTEIPLSPTQLALCPGHYATPHGSAMEITTEAGRLYTRLAGQSRFEIFAASETELFLRVLPAQLHVEFAEGRAIAVSLHQHGTIQRFPRVDAETAPRLGAPVERRAEAQRQPRQRVPIDPALLDRYVGTYRMDKDRLVTVTAEAGRLYVGLTGQPCFEVFPESATRFFWTVTAAQIAFFAEGGGPAGYAVLYQHGTAMPLPRLDPAG